MKTPLRIGVIGLGRAFTLMLPTFQQDPRVQLVAATDPLPQACAQFEKDFQGQVTSNAETLCALPENALAGDALRQARGALITAIAVIATVPGQATSGKPTRSPATTRKTR